jgi:hypothetical protein
MWYREGDDIHRWRHEWRKSKGSQPQLWGNDKQK